MHTRMLICLLHQLAVHCMQRFTAANTAPAFVPVDTSSTLQIVEACAGKRIAAQRCQHGRKHQAALNVTDTAAPPTPDIAIGLILTLLRPLKKRPAMPTG